MAHILESAPPAVTPGITNGDPVVESRDPIDLDPSAILGKRKRARG